MNQAVMDMLVTHEQEILKLKDALREARAATIDEIAHHYFLKGNVALATDIQRLKDKK